MTCQAFDGGDPRAQLDHARWHRYRGRQVRRNGVVQSRPSGEAATAAVMRAAVIMAT